MFPPRSNTWFSVGTQRGTAGSPGTVGNLPVLSTSQRCQVCLKVLFTPPYTASYALWCMKVHTIRTSKFLIQVKTPELTVAWWIEYGMIRVNLTILHSWECVTTTTKSHPFLGRPLFLLHTPDCCLICSVADVNKSNGFKSGGNWGFRWFFAGPILVMFLCACYFWTFISIMVKW